MNLEKYPSLSIIQRSLTIFTSTLILLFFSNNGNAQPVNNNCANATVLTVGASCTNGNNILANLQLGEPSAAGCWFSAADNTVWYTFTTGTAGSYVISTDNGGTTDTQIKLYSSACGTYTEIGCDDDGGTTYDLASWLEVTLAASTQYWIQVDVYGVAQAAFCIRVFQAVRPTNDCITNAIDISFLINPVNTTNPYDCYYTYTYNATIATGDDPTRQDIVGDPNGCNGQVSPPPPVMTPHPIHFDTWFRFTVSGTTPDAFLHLFPVSGSALMVMGLYSGTPVTSCPTGSISGLTQIDCSAGEILAIPDPFNTYGGARDKSICSTPIHPRLDIGNLPLGTYYVRVWDFHAGDTIPDPPGTGIFTLCAESTDPRPYTTDICTTAANIGYLGSAFNVDVNSTYNDLSNAGCHGNTYGGPSSFVCPGLQPNEPLLGATPSGEARPGCSGGWFVYAGVTNNIMNVTSIHTFQVSACPTCEPTVLLTFNNIESDGTPGNAFQLQVMAPGTCASSTQTVMNVAEVGSCIQLRPFGNTPLTNGLYSIVVDGQDGQLLLYDLTLSLNYPCDSVISCFPLPVHLLAFTGENHKGINYLKWSTASEINNDHFEIERSSNAIDFITIHTVRGAGNSTSVHEYTSMDANAPIGTSYYRLKQVDFNGEFEYSNIIAVKNSFAAGSLSIEKIDNVSLLANYTTESSEEITIRLIDIKGHILHSANMHVNAGTNQFSINAEQLQHGLYILEVIDHLRNSSKIRFVK
jgi:hypothetical protein